MKILFWTDAFWPEIGGLEVFCANMVRALKKRGHVCEVITNRPDETAGFVFEDCAVHPFPFQETLNRGRLKIAAQQFEMCRRIVDQFQPDVIHQHGITRSIFHFTRQQKSQRRPAVITLHDNLLAPEKQAMAAWALEHAEQVVAISDYIHREAQARIPTLDGRLRTILNALPTPEISPAPLPPSPRLLAIGRLAAHKGFDLAIRAFSTIAKQFPDATLTLAGDGEDRALLETLATESGFGSRIHFTGWISPEKILEIINQHSLVIVPSRWQEPFGLVALQTAQLGRPVIASNAGGLPEIIVDGVTGKLYENEDLSDLTESLQLLLADPALAASMGRAAQVRATTHFRFDRLILQYEETYERARNARR